MILMRLRIWWNNRKVGGFINALISAQNRAEGVKSEIDKKRDALAKSEEQCEKVIKFTKKFLDEDDNN